MLAGTKHGGTDSYRTERAYTGCQILSESARSSSYHGKEFYASGN